MATLLSGWRIRLTDATNEPLQAGRLAFFDSSTSLPKAVYSDDTMGTSLGTTVEADLEGWLPAIWLGEGLYDAVCQVKISESPDVWDDLWNLEHLGTEVGASTVAGTVTVFDTMANFRAADSASYDSAQVLGYYTPGDFGAPAIFRWDASSTKTDDGGAYIKHANQGFGAIGRSIQIFSDKDCDVRKWGGIPSAGLDLTASLVYCEQYATQSEWGVNPPAVVFPGNTEVGLSDYTFVGDVVLDAATAGAVKIKYRLGQGARIQGLTHGIAVTYSNPTIIDSDSPIYEYTNTITFAAGSLEFVKPQWFYGATVYDQVAAAKVVDAPLVIDRIGEIVIPAATYCTFTNGVSITGYDYFTIPSGSTVEFRGAFTPKYEDGYYFLGTGLALMAYASSIRASWFGFGALAGNDQGTALQHAIDCSLPNQTVIVQPVPTTAKKVLSAVYGNGCTLDITSFLRIGSGGSVTGVYMDSAWESNPLIMTDGGYVTLLNPEISPYWFGVTNDVEVTGNSTNAAALVLALESAARGGNTLLNRSTKYLYVNSTVAVTLTSSQQLHLKDILLAPWTDGWSAGTPALQITGGISNRLTMSNVTITHVPCACLYVSVGISDISGCRFDSPTTLFGEDYRFHSNSYTNSYGLTTLDPVGFSSAYRYGDIHDNDFGGLSVAIYGEATATHSRTPKYLENVNMHHNRISGVPGSSSLGYVYIYSLAANTRVQGVNIDHNILKHHGTGATRITNAGIGGAATTPWATKFGDSFTTHSIRIADNVAYTTSGTRDVIPTTVGSFRVSTEPTVPAASFYASRPSVVFELVNADQEYTKLIARARGCTDGEGVFYAGGAAAYTDEIADPISIGYTDAVVGFYNFFWIDFETYGNAVQGL